MWPGTTGWAKANRRQPGGSGADAQFAEYRAANADGARACLEVQAKLNDLAAIGEATADVPWLPTLGTAVRGALRCSDLGAG